MLFDLIFVIFDINNFKSNLFLKDSTCKTDLSFLAPQYLANSSPQVLNSTRHAHKEAVLNAHIFEALGKIGNFILDKEIPGK